MHVIHSMVTNILLWKHNEGFFHISITDFEVIEVALLSKLSRVVSLRAVCWTHCCTCAITMIWSYQCRIRCCFMLKTVLSSHMIETPKFLLICLVLILLKLHVINCRWTMNCHYLWARQNAFFLVPRLNWTKFLTFVLPIYDDHIIKSQESINYLGVSLDSTLSGENMVNSVIKKVVSRFKFLYRHAHILNQTLYVKISVLLLFNVTWTTIVLLGKEYWRVTSPIFFFFFYISAFSWQYFNRTWWKTLTHQISHELVHGGPRYGRMNT